LTLYHKSIMKKRQFLSTKKTAEFLFPAVLII
jgi:hypothetical protein